MILIIYAHPYPKHSRAGAAMLAAVRELPGVELRSIYDLYPDFDIDAAAEQAALLRAETVVWLHPTYWYSPPALLKHWFEMVLTRGWAYGTGGEALKGKRCLWVPTTGGDEAAYTPGGMHEQPFDNFIAPIEQTARFCGMQWQPPIIVHGAHVVSEEQLQAKAEEFRARLIALGRKESGKQADKESA